MSRRLTFREQGSRLSGYQRQGAGQTPFGLVEIGFRGEHDVTVVGDEVPTVHLDDVLLEDGRSRILSRPGTIAVDGVVGSVAQRKGLRLSRSAMTVTAEVAGRTYTLRMEGLNRVTVRRVGHGAVGWVRTAGPFRMHARADATDLAVALALTDAIDRDAVSVLPGG